MSVNRAEMVSIWERWDTVMEAMPRHASHRFGERETNMMEDACQVLAAELGMDCSQMRRDLIAALGEGMSRAQAVDHVALQAVGR